MVLPVTLRHAKIVSAKSLKLNNPRKFCTSKILCYTVSERGSDNNYACWCAIHSCIHASPTVTCQFSTPGVLPHLC